MRLWSLHPRYLDAKGLTACWREGLLARKVLAGATRGYRNHPQLQRFRAAPDPGAALVALLWELVREAERRGYRFDPSRIFASGEAQDAARYAAHEAQVPPIPVTRGQLAYERELLLTKLERRDPLTAAHLAREAEAEPSPVFIPVEGDIEAWERVIPEVAARRTHIRLDKA